jgi:hypothetical protein
MHVCIGADWASVTYGKLQTRTENQKDKRSRLPILKWDEVERCLPPGFMHPSPIVWNQVCLGYVPELATDWETLMRTNAGKMRTKIDRIFGISLFRVVTRTNAPPYCMGHGEMNWDAARLSRSLIAERSQLLAGRDWSSFPAAEQRAFVFARKLIRYSARISVEDIDMLKHDFGTERAFFALVYACRCNYMTRISNGFQLGLERDNVFFEYYSDEKETAGTDGARTARERP